MCRVGVDEHLLISIDSDEVNAADIRRNHPIDGVVSAAADAYYLYINCALKIFVKFKWHFYVLRIYYS